MTVDLSKFTGVKAPAPFRPASSRCRAAIVRKDVTPKIGIYNRSCERPEPCVLCERLRLGGRVWVKLRLRLKG